MRIHRLRVVNFAGIRDADIEFGPGLNVLYGPNDLGKSTLVDAIRLALLLPHASTHHEQYVGWTFREDPIVELTFETEAQRIWRVKKVFAKGGSSLLRESRNGQDFDDVERGRRVDAKLREILCWGIPEPGGVGGAKGIPTSYLATALLSLQADVSALLKESLQNDPTGTGKEQIARALQAASQDPLFIALLRTVQEQRDKAYTDKGAKKTAKGTVFKEAAERLNRARDEKDRLQQLVDDSEGAERQLEELTTKRARSQEELAFAAQWAASLERLAREAGDRADAAAQVAQARDEVVRIQRIGADVDETERMVAKLVRTSTEAEQALGVAQSLQAEAEAALQTAEQAARAEGSDPGFTDTVVRQQLELRKSAAEQAASVAQRRIDGVLAARELVNAVVAAERDLREQHAKAGTARKSSSDAAAKEKALVVELLQCDLLERALDAHAANEQAARAQAEVAKEAALTVRLEAELGERAKYVARRAAITVPIPGALPSMRRLASDLAAARAALDVGFVVTVSPNRRIDLRIRRDGMAVDSKPSAKSLEVEANAEVEIAIADIATIRVRGGRREAQETAQALEDRWSRDVAPHLVSAGVSDLDGLESKVEEVRGLDASITAKEMETESLRAQIAALASAAEALRQASLRVELCRDALGDARLDSLAADLASLGADPVAGLRKRRQNLAKQLDAARATASQAASAHLLADERAKNSRSALDTATSARDVALKPFPEGSDAALVAAREALSIAGAEKERIVAESASLESSIASRRKRIDAALAGARAKSDDTKAAVETARRELAAAVTDRASHEGRLIELRKLRDGQELAAAEIRLHEATERHSALPVPSRIVTGEEVTAAQDAAARIRSDLEAIEREIHRKHGALEHVGGEVAREGLRDAVEAFELAERQEREVEDEYEAWKLLLSQMKEADSAQASNLGQALAPAIASRFQELTQRRYETVQLTAQLGTEGFVVAGTVRPMERISVGTREQLSTLYRLSIAEHLRTAIVLDDQLVQSDDIRMDWFRQLLTEKARTFQIVVFTCRPSDYLAATAMVPKGNAVHADTDGGFVRAIDLGRAVHRR